MESVFFDAVWAHIKNFWINKLLPATSRRRLAVSHWKRRLAGAGRGSPLGTGNGR